jgi:hypothetical protein
MPDEQIGGAFVEIGGKTDKLKKDLRVAEGMVKSSLESAAKIASQFAGPAGKPLGALLGAGGVTAAGAEAAQQFATIERARMDLKTELARTGRATDAEIEAYVSTMEKKGDKMALSTLRVMGLARDVAAVTKGGPEAVDEVLKLLPGAMQKHRDKTPEQLTGLITKALYTDEAMAAIRALEIPGVGPQMLPREAIPRMKDVLTRRGAMEQERLKHDVSGALSRLGATLDDAWNLGVEKFGELFLGKAPPEVAKRRMGMARAGGVVEMGIGPTARRMGYRTENMWSMPPDLWAINKAEVAEAASPLPAATAPTRRIDPLGAKIREGAQWLFGGGGEGRSPGVTGPDGMGLPYPNTGLPPVAPFFAPTGGGGNEDKLNDAADKLEKAALRLERFSDDPFAARLA